MIQIEGLNKKQTTLLNIMWSMDKMDQIRSWQSTLPEGDQVMCDTLLKMVSLAYLDESIDADLELTEAREIIYHITQK